MTATALYLFGAAWTASALLIYAHRHPVTDTGLGITLGGWALLLLVAAGWFVLVPACLALYLLDAHGYVNASLARFRATLPPPEMPKPAKARAKTNGRPRHAALRQVLPNAKPAPAPAPEAAVEPVSLVKGDPEVRWCPACGQREPLDDDGYFAAHYPVTGAKTRYCRGSRVKAPRRT